MLWMARQCASNFSNMFSMAKKIGRLLRQHGGNSHTSDCETHGTHTTCLGGGVSCHVQLALPDSTNTSTKPGGV